jgi:hypothetical protein
MAILNPSAGPPLPIETREIFDQTAKISPGRMNGRERMKRVTWEPEIPALKIRWSTQDKAYNPEGTNIIKTVNPKLKPAICLRI